MGTILEVTVVADDLESARRLAAESVALAQHWEDVLTTWRADGELRRLNRSAGRGTIRVSEDLADALRHARTLVHQTAGAFDPSVAPVVAVLRSRGGAQRGTSEHAATRHIDDVLWLKGARASLAPDTALDAGAFGKGVALDAIASRLVSGGARAWFLDFGGSSQLAHGRPERADAWSVVVTGEGAGVVRGLVQLDDASLSTSCALAADDPAGAVVDPRTGKAVTPPRRASVLARDATSADAWATALVVLGRDGLALARAAGVEAIFEDATGSVSTPGFPLDHPVSMQRAPVTQSIHIRPRSERHSITTSTAPNNTTR
jgi:FAD:protein FMN transferase